MVLSFVQQLGINYFSLNAQFNCASLGNVLTRDLYSNKVHLSLSIFICHLKIMWRWKKKRFCLKLSKTTFSSNFVRCLLQKVNTNMFVRHHTKPKGIFRRMEKCFWYKIISLPKFSKLIWKYFFLDIAIW